MKGGAENRKKTVLLGVLVAVALCGILYNLFSVFGGGSSAPPPTVAPVATAPARSTAAGGSASARNSATVAGAVPGVAAQKLATTSAALDPTLDPAAMLRTESLVYSGSGRNIFSATYTPPPSVALPSHVPSARPRPKGPPAPAVPMGPPPPPPIPLKFFGTAQRRHGPKQIFLLSGDDVYLASQGDIVAKRYKIDRIMITGVTVTDLVNNNTQMLPLQQ